MRECGLREVPAARTPFSNQAAATGWAWTASGAPLFPGYLSPSEGVTFESLGRVGYAAWDAVPESGKFQILGVIGILELLGEASVKPHYMSGGTPGKIPLLWDPLGFTAKLSPEALARKRNSELKNGWAAAPPPTRARAPPPSPRRRGCTPRRHGSRPPALPSHVPPCFPTTPYLLPCRRLAMLGVASFVSGHFIPDSVPLLPANM